jgi:mono/diheme cytochrome c family protein
MSKSSLLLFAVALLAITCLPLQGGGQQPTAPTQAPATPPAATPAPAPAVNPPETEAPPPAAPVRNPVKPTAESQAKAKTLYRMDCSMCHGDNGNGKTGLATSMELTLNDWTDPKSLAGKQDWELFNIIRVGKGKMPPESKGRAPDNDVWNLVIYIRTFSK